MTPDDDEALVRRFCAEIDAGDLWSDRDDLAPPQQLGAITLPGA